MDLSLAPSLNGWSAGRWLPQLEVDTCSFDFASIPDPLRLRHEGVVIRRNEDAPEDAVSDWCDRAHQCLRFLAATDPSRIWIWQEQVLPILLALSSTLAARRAGLSARRALTADQSPIRLRRGQGAKAPSRKEGVIRTAHGYRQAAFLDPCAVHTKPAGAASAP